MGRVERDSVWVKFGLNRDPKACDTRVPENFGYPTSKSGSDWIDSGTLKSIIFEYYILEYYVASRVIFQSDFTLILSLIFIRFD